MNTIASINDPDVSFFISERWSKDFIANMLADSATHHSSRVASVSDVGDLHHCYRVGHDKYRPMLEFPAVELSLLSVPSNRFWELKHHFPFLEGKEFDCLSFSFGRTDVLYDRCRRYNHIGPYLIESQVDVNHRKSTMIEKLVADGCGKTLALFDLSYAHSPRRLVNNQPTRWDLIYLILRAAAAWSRLGYREAKGPPQVYARACATYAMSICSLVAPFLDAAVLPMVYPVQSPHQFRQFGAPAPDTSVLSCYSGQSYYEAFNQALTLLDGVLPPGRRAVVTSSSESARVTGVSKRISGDKPRGLADLLHRLPRGYSSYDGDKRAIEEWQECISPLMCASLPRSVAVRCPSPFLRLTDYMPPAFSLEGARSLRSERAYQNAVCPDCEVPVPFYPMPETFWTCTKQWLGVTARMAITTNRITNYVRVETGSKAYCSCQTPLLATPIGPLRVFHVEEVPMIRSVSLLDVMHPREPDYESAAVVLNVDTMAMIDLAKEPIPVVAAIINSYIDLKGAWSWQVLLTRQMLMHSHKLSFLNLGKGIPYQEFVNVGRFANMFHAYRLRIWEVSLRLHRAFNVPVWRVNLPMAVWGLVSDYLGRFVAHRADTFILSSHARGYAGGAGRLLPAPSYHPTVSYNQEDGNLRLEVVGKSFGSHKGCLIDAATCSGIVVWPQVQPPIMRVTTLLHHEYLYLFRIGSNAPLRCKTFCDLHDLFHAFDVIHEGRIGSTRFLEFAHFAMRFMYKIEPLSFGGFNVSLGLLCQRGFSTLVRRWQRQADGETFDPVVHTEGHDANFVLVVAAGRAHVHQ